MSRFVRFGKSLLLCTILALMTIPALAQDSVMFNYQGRVKVQETDFSGTGQFKFAILSPDKKSTLWSNDSTSVDGLEPTTGLDITVTNGVFNVLMGANGKMDEINATIFQNKAPLKLRTWFSDGPHGFQQLVPDHNLININLITSQTGSSDFTIYVNGGTGDDSNSGLTADEAKKTIQAAVDIVPSRVMADVTIDIADGTYAEEILLYGISCKPGKSLTLLGDENWTPTAGGSPKVIITGAVGDTPHVRKTLEAVQCDGVVFNGLSLRDSSWIGLSMQNGVYTVRNCEARNNVANGINFGRHVAGEIYSSLSTGNTLHGIGVNVNSRAIIKDCVAVENDISGMVVMDQSSAVLDGTGVFSNNAGHGIYCINNSSVGALNTFSGEVEGNDGFGIYAGWDAHFSNFLAHSTIINNTQGNTSSGSGGNLNW